MDRYLDHAAAARILPCAVDAYAAACRDCFANAEAVHNMAYQVRSRMTADQKTISGALLPGEKNIEVIPVGSGSDGFRLFYDAFPQGTIVTTRAEHPALAANLKRAGKELRLAPLSADGGVNLDAFAALLDSSVKLVAIGHVQSETGRIQPVAELADIVRQKVPNALIFCDEVQAAGKIPVAAGTDLLLFSGHKIGAPSGGAMILRSKRAREIFSKRFADFRHVEYLSGRAEAPVLAGLAAALEHRMARLAASQAAVAELSAFLRQRLDGKLLPNGKELKMTVPAELASPYILHFSLPGYQSAVLVRMLSAQGIHVSSGSACQAETSTPSAVLTAMGWKKEAAFAAMRVSFDADTTLAECEEFLLALEMVLADY